MNGRAGSGKRRGLLIWTAAALVIVILSGWMVPPDAGLAAGGWADGLRETVGLSGEARAAAYGQLRFDTGEWEIGLVLSRHPLAVVTEVHGAGSDLEEAAAVRIWTGLISRADDDLIVVWDELRLDAAGSPVSVLLAQPKLLPDYFAAEHQRTYRNAQYAGFYPWAYIPTDPEAAEAGAEPVAKGGVIDLYGNDFGEAAVNMQVAGPVAPSAAIPDRILSRPSYATRGIDEIPADIAGHWAEPYALALMRLGIADGYEDGTVRPSRVLSRAEFVKLALSAALLPPDGNETGYPDVAGHWAAPYVTVAEAHGIVPRGDGFSAFRPDEPISREEMAVLLQRILAALRLPLPEKRLSFPDTEGLDGLTRYAIEAVAGHGILNGFEDGTFRPGEPLTRAQAFVAIAKLAEWL